MQDCEVPCFGCTDAGVRESETSLFALFFPPSLCGVEWKLLCGRGSLTPAVSSAPAGCQAPIAWSSSHAKLRQTAVKLGCRAVNWGKLETCVSCWYSCNSHRFFLSIAGQGSECKPLKWNPKGDELLQITVRPWETAVQAGLCTDVQFVCRSLE